MPLDTAHIDYLVAHSLGRLATIAPNGTPQNKPVGYRYNAALGTIDIAGFEMENSAKYRNVAHNPDVSFVVDDVSTEDAERVRFLELRGQAEQVKDPSVTSSGGLSAHIIRIHPRRLVSWNIAPDHPALLTADLTPEAASSAEPHRPTLGATGGIADSAIHAVEQLVSDLQHGLDRRDADIYDRRFAADVIWGGPFGATVAGYERLNAIDKRLNERGVGGPLSRYEIVHTLTPAPGIAIAHVRRLAVDRDGNQLPGTDETSSAFSEMALYVLIRRAGTWWLVAGQNTPIHLSQAPLTR